MIDSDYYPICGLVNKDVVHALWNCPATGNVWSVCYRKVKKLSGAFHGFIDLILVLTNLLDPQELATVAGIMRKFWF